MFKQGVGYSVHTCRAKSTRNPLYRWLIDGSGAIHAFAFSPCTHYLAVVSADGQLRVFNYDQMELVGAMKSYFGGLRCVAWSPDGRYIATGGEDDLVTIWSFAGQRVVCRGSGHRSWVNGVSFDAFTTTIVDDCVSTSPGAPNAAAAVAAENAENHSSENHCSDVKPGHGPRPTADKESVVTCYRLGSVGDDAMLCLWDITEDVLVHNNTANSGTRLRTTSIAGVSPTGDITSGESADGNGSPCLANNHHTSAASTASTNVSTATSTTATSTSPRPTLLTSSSESSGLAQKFASLSITEQHRNKEAAASASAKRPFGTLVNRTSDTRLVFVRSKPGVAGSSGAAGDTVPSVPPLGSPGCPCLSEVPLLEPLVCKQVAHERLTAILFREDCLVLACQEGFVSTWARPSVLTKNGYTC
jgi:hypothetical protein